MPSLTNISSTPRYVQTKQRKQSDILVFSSSSQEVGEKFNFYLSAKIFAGICAFSQKLIKNNNFWLHFC